MFSEWVDDGDGGYTDQQEPDEEIVIAILFLVKDVCTANNQETPKDDFGHTVIERYFSGP